MPNRTTTQDLEEAESQVCPLPNGHLAKGVDLRINVSLTHDQAVLL